MRNAGLVVGIACAAATVLVLGACGSGSGGFVEGGGQSAGKTLFTERCAGCHTLADAGSSSTIGPNLDDAFEQSRIDGMTTSTFTQVVAGQIRFPVENTSTGAPGMPPADSTLPSCDDAPDGSFCVEDQEQAIADVATYVGAVAGTGITAEKPTDGVDIFAANCASCHTLADAGSNGQVGPNLDQLKPTKDQVSTIVRNGRGQMPSFGASLDAQQIEAVAEYVSSSAGK